MERTTKENGHTFDRSGFRVVGMMHLAPSKDEAIADVAYGLDDYFDYAQQVIGGNLASGPTFAKRLEWVLDSGTAVVGTADEAIAKLEHLIEVSGGVGAFLLWGHEWASPEATRRSYEIFARRVIPALTGTSRRIEQSRDAAAAGVAARRHKAPAH
jgi:limonene 1,2-monooxygenase